MTVTCGNLIQLIEEKPARTTTTPLRDALRNVPVPSYSSRDNIGDRVPQGPVPTHPSRQRHNHVEQFLAGVALETGEPVHNNHFNAVAPGRVSLAEPGLEHLLRSAATISSGRAGPQRPRSALGR